MVWGKKPSDDDTDDRQPLLPKSNSAVNLNDENRNPNTQSKSASGAYPTENNASVKDIRSYLTITNPTQSSGKKSDSSQGGTRLNGSHGESTLVTARVSKGDETQPQNKMPWFDKRKRIILFIAVDFIFFLVEIITGYTVHSLALVADAFHMLNDIISLFVGLWAVGAAQTRESSHEYTYGWVRSEILGGFANGVFLIALCLDLVLESIQRFFEPQKVSNPKLVLIVGAVGLASNILGLFVFHQHAHSHGEEDSHVHEHINEPHTAEIGHSHPSHTHDENSSKFPGNTLHDDPKRKPAQGDSHKHSKSVDVTAGSGGTITWIESLNPTAANSTATRRGRSRSRRQASLNLDIPIHPASFRNEFIQQARMGKSDSDSETDDNKGTANGNFRTEDEDVGLSISHHEHLHRRPKVGPKGGHSHSHEDMNIRGIFLHVLGDALGNVGVMASALIIWKTPWSFRHHFDPIISLFITLIILKSAVPLVKEAGRSLLQATPRDISVDDIRKDILTLPKVLDCHHLHVWALTAKKRVATLDVKLDLDIAKGPVKYMELIKGIKQCLREHGVHSSTIQPEFYTGTSTRGNSCGNNANTNLRVDTSGGLGLGACLLDNEEDEYGKQCCTPRNGPGSGTVTPLTAHHEH